MPEQQSQSGCSWPTAHCKRVHLDPSVLGGASVKQLHSAQCPTHSTFQKNFLPFTWGKAATCDCILSQGSVAGDSISAQTLQGACSAHWGRQQFSYSSCAAKGHEHQRGAQQVPLPLCAKGMGLFLIADAHISLKSQQKWKAHLAENSF